MHDLPTGRCVLQSMSWCNRQRRRRRGGQCVLCVSEGGRAAAMGVGDRAVVGAVALSRSQSCVFELVSPAHSGRASPLHLAACARPVESRGLCGWRG